ncbi:unnamed protein product [Adineta steineri]|nr:unnamed protein product [Adineta steineri]
MHLPLNDTIIYVKIKQCLELIFQLDNNLYGWGELIVELSPAIKYNLFNWPIKSTIYDIQRYFPQCTCHASSPSRTGEKWGLQEALVYTGQMFLDKSMRRNHWSLILDPNHSILTRRKRNQIVSYAIYNCFTTTYLAYPVLQYWTFQQIEVDPKNNSLLWCVVSSCQILRGFKMRSF